MALTITIPGAIEATTGATAPAVLTIGVGIPGPGVPTGGTAGQVLKKLSSTNYDTAWQTDLNSGVWGSITGDITAQTDLQTSLGLKADLASPALTGVPTAPTASTLTSTTQLATTAFVQQELAAGTAIARNLEVEVRNQSGASIPAGSIVYISGATGNKPLITLSQANNDANSAQTMGFVKTTIANNGTGYVIVRGVLENIDTSALTEGAQLYLSPTTAGTWTTTKPYAPSHLVYVGVVIRSHPNQGTILVAVQNGYELDELHNVAAQTPSDLDLLSYESSTSLWKNKSFSTLGLATQAWVDAQGYLQAGALTGYATQSWVTSQGYLTSASLTGYATEAWVTTALGSYLTTSAAASTYQTLSGMSSYLTTSSASSTYQTISGMSSYLTTATAASTYAPIASPGLTGNVTITTNSANPALVITQDGAGDIIQFKDVTSDTTYAFIDANGKVSTIASTTTNAGFNVPHATAAPTSPVNGDIWTTTSGLFMRQNGSTKQYVDLDGTQTINGTKTFSASSLTLGNSTAAATYNLGTGATLTATTKAINIGTNGVAGSTTNIAIGSTTGTNAITINGPTTLAGTVTASGTTLDLGNASGTATYSLGSGTTTTGLTKTVNVGTSGGTGSTTSITIGTGVGSTTTNIYGAVLQGGGTGVTAAADTNTTALATTAFVVGQAGSATPIVNGTAAVGTSLRYARQDHVHPTDTSRAALASPTFTGTPAAPTAAVDTNTTQLATTAFVIGQGYLKSATASSTYAPLASPALTGTPTAPTAIAGTNTTQIATTAFVAAAVSAGSGAVWGSITGTLSSQTDLNSALSAKLDSTTAASTYYLQTNPSGYITSSALTPYLTTATAATTYAPLASPTFTGTVTIPAGASISGYLTSATAALTYAPLASPTFTGTVTIPAGASISGYATTASLASYAPLASPTLTGVPLSTTAAADTNTTQIATTAYVVGQASATSPAMNGTATVGTSLKFARADHIHPTDTSRAPLASPTFTGTPAAPTAAALTNTTALATTAFVRADNNVKAWVSFNGTGTVAINANYNVTSITDNGVGDYTVNFTSALADANYGVAGYTRNAGGAGAVTLAAINTSGAQTTSACRFVTSYAAAGVDCVQVNAVFYR